MPQLFQGSDHSVEDPPEQRSGAGSSQEAPRGGETTSWFLPGAVSGVGAQRLRMGLSSGLTPASIPITAAWVSGTSLSAFPHV